MQPFIQGESLEAIAIGTGPSFYDEFLKREEIRYQLDDGSPYEPRLVGCGLVPLYLNGLWAYCYGDMTHLGHIPRPDHPYHPGVRNYATSRNLHDFDQLEAFTYVNGVRVPRRSDAMLPYAELDIPHGNSSGGMAFSLACLHYNVVGFVGYDGRNKAAFASQQDYDDFVFRFRFLINYWQNRGRRIISLMSDSVFNSITEPAIGKIPQKKIIP